MRRDLSGTVVVAAAFVLLSAVSWLDLTDGKLGSAFSVAFVLIVMTAPMAVTLRSIVTTGILPPALLILTLLGIVIIDPSGVPAQGLASEAGTLSRAIAATLDRGLTLVIGHGLALAMIVLRNMWATRARALTLQRA